MKITMLGTGNALVTECYNTCFVLEDEGEYFMIDGGGGNEVLKQLKRCRAKLDGYARYLCHAQAYRPHSRHRLDDAPDLPEYE